MLNVLNNSLCYIMIKYWCYILWLLQLLHIFIPTPHFLFYCFSFLFHLLHLVCSHLPSFLLCCLSSHSSGCVCLCVVCSSYGSVYKALHKESGQVLAIKQVPVDTDLQEIIKEISIMQQCDSTYIVKYYGSYFKNTDLWVSCNDL